MRGPHLRSGPLKGLKRARQDGKLYIYHRATGIRMPDLPENHPDFIKAYQAAQDAQANGTARPRGPDRTRPGTIAATWQAYLRSDTYRSLSDSYRDVRRRDGFKLARKAPTVPVASIRAHHIRNDLATLAPNAARERRKTWRALMAFALERGLITGDPSRAVAPPKTPRSTQHRPWTAEDCAAFRAHWPIGTRQRAAFELLHWTGARISDVIRMGPGMISRDGWLEFSQMKTGGKVAIPFSRTPPAFAPAKDLAQLHAALDALPDRHMTWVTKHGGGSRSHKSASQWFSAAARAANLQGLTAHGLRVTRARHLAEHGATTHQIGAWTGHESLKEIDHYSRSASRKIMLAGPEGEQEIVQNIKS